MPRMDADKSAHGCLLCRENNSLFPFPRARMICTQESISRSFISTQLEHAKSKLLIVDCELAGVAKDALEMIGDPGLRPRLIQAEDSRHPEWAADDGEEEMRDFLRYSTASKGLLEVQQVAIYEGVLQTYRYVVLEYVKCVLVRYGQNWAIWGTAVRRL